MTKILRAAVFLFVFVPTVAGAQSAITNQRLTDTVPFMPEHHVRRLAAFSAEPMTKGTIIFMGNSITEGGDWPRLLGDTTVVNRGIGGDITFGLLKRLDDIVARKPSCLFVMIGINDIAKDIPGAVIADNYRRLIEEVQENSPGTRIYVQSILPVNSDVPGFPQGYDKLDHVVSVNRLLAQVADSTGTHFLDLFPVLVDSQNRLDAAYTYDGLHLNDRGYQVWAAHLKAGGRIERCARR